MKPSRALAAIGFVVCLHLVGSPEASAHPGGLNGAGCHAGSQPYHCHSGGSSSGGSAGSSSGGSGSNTVDSGPSEQEIAREQEIAKLAEVESAEAAAARSQNDLAKSREHVETIESGLAAAGESLEKQRNELKALRADAAELNEKADRLRRDHIEEGKAAAKRVNFVDAANQQLVEQHKTERRASGFVAGLFGGLLLLGPMRWLASLLVGGRPWILLGGLISSLVLVTMGFAMFWAPGGVLVSLAGGLVMAATLMLVRIWWIAARLPRIISFGLVGIATIFAIGALATALSATPPAEQQPPAEDIAMAEELQEDPDAEGLDPAQEAEAAAQALQSEIAEIDQAIAAQQSKLDELNQELAASEEQVAAAEDEANEAEDYLESLR